MEHMLGRQKAEVPKCALPWSDGQKGSYKMIIEKNVYEGALFLKKKRWDKDFFISLHIHTYFVVDALLL